MNEFLNYEAEAECKHWDTCPAERSELVARSTMLAFIRIEANKARREQKPAATGNAKEQYERYSAQLKQVVASAPKPGWITAMPKGLQIVSEILYSLGNKIEDYGEKAYPLSTAQITLIERKLNEFAVK